MTLNDRVKHEAIICENEQDLTLKIASLIEEGVAEKLKVIVAVSETLKEYLTSKYQALITENSLLVLSWEESYFVNGRFNSSDMIKLIEESIKSVDLNRFKGMRGIGDMGWIQEDYAGCENSVEYEQKINLIRTKVKTDVYCIYSREVFGEDMIRLIKRVHKIPVEKVIAK